MFRTIAYTVCVLTALLLAGFCSSAEALTVDIIQDWTPDLAVTGNTTFSFTFDLDPYGFDAPGTTINSAQLSLLTWNVDTNANIPAGGSSGGGSSSIYYYNYVADLTDVLSVEGASGGLGLPGGTGATTVDLSSGTDNYLYLRDGGLSLQLDVNETNTWHSSGWSSAGSHPYTYSETHTGQYWVREGFYLFGIWIDTGSHWHYYTYTDYHTYSIVDYTTTNYPNYDGTLYLDQLKLTVDYTQSPDSPQVPEPASMALLGLGISMAVCRFKKK